MAKRHDHRDATDDATEQRDETTGVPRSSGRMPKVHARRTLSSPTPTEVLDEVLELATTATAERGAEELVRLYLDACARLFPGRNLAVRLVSMDTGRPTLHMGTAPLAHDHADRIRIGRDALKRHRLHPIDAPLTGIEVAPGFSPVFVAGARGFEAPLLDGRRVTGVLTVEYALGDAVLDSDVSFLVPLALDLSAKLRTGRLLRESRYLRDYLGKLIEHANAPIIVIGRNRDIRVVNRAFLTLTGMERDLILARDFFDLLPVEETTRLLPVFIKALRGEPSTSFEVRIPRVDSGSVRLLINTASILNAEGEVDAIIAIGRDLTELRELEAQVIQAEKLATLGQISASVVHELNNPLTSISAHADYLARRHANDQDPIDRDKLGAIQQSVSRILDFTRDLGTYARPSSEAPRLVAIHAVLDQAIAFCSHVVEKSNAKLERVYDSAIPRIYAVPSHLHQVFINLITNAAHALAAAGGTIRVDAALDNEGNVAVSVRDDGAGIDPDKLDRIFEPFFSTKREGEGTGLGLSIVRNIIEMHRGTIRVTSIPNAGSVFTVTLPSTTR